MVGALGLSNARHPQWTATVHDRKIGVRFFGQVSRVSPNAPEATVETPGMTEISECPRIH